MQKKLYRNVNNKMLSGVCAGLADYLNVDVTLVRLVVAALVIFVGAVIFGLIFYFICAAIIPAAPAPETQFGAASPVYPQQPPTYAPPTQPVATAQPQSYQSPYQQPSVTPSPASTIEYQDISSSTPVPEEQGE
ncbi:MAG: PspC domain-containing protein [Oscillospiraceae bacterium]|jgi:phage shock protein C|nr:PspC domain-containing protein [Oscillospiraceae bacterium]